MSSTYNDQFFRDQRIQAQASGREIVPMVMQWLSPRSVVDVGCGGGTWLSVFIDRGISDVLGIDGPWAANIQQLPPGQFLSHDLTTPLKLERRFDLCISLEVAEHLPEESASGFVKMLVGLSSVVLFSAAIPLQGGTHHVNEQWPDYWESLFSRNGFTLIDAIRPVVWDNARVDWFYAQNTFLYVDEMHLKSQPTLLELASRPRLPLRMIHPRNYLDKARRAEIGVAEILRLGPTLVRDAIARRLAAFHNLSKK